MNAKEVSAFSIFQAALAAPAAVSIARQLKDIVGLDLFRLFRLAITTHVRRDSVETRFGKSAKLMPPRIPGLRRSVAKQNPRTGSRFRIVHLDAVGSDELMSDLSHVLLLYLKRIGDWVPDRSTYFFVQVSSSVFFHAPLT